MSARTYRKRAAALVVAVSAGMIVVEPASACGYEDPQSVSRGSLNGATPTHYSLSAQFLMKLRRGGCRSRISIAVRWIYSDADFKPHPHP